MEGISAWMDIFPGKKVGRVHYFAYCLLNLELQYDHPSDFFGNNHVVSVLIKNDLMATFSDFIRLNRELTR